MQINLVEYQKATEKRYSKRNINDVVQTYIESDEDYDALLDKACASLEKYRDADYYDSKQIRVNQLRNRDMKRLALDVMVVTLPIAESMLFTAVVGMVAEKLKFTDRIEGIKTAGEILAVMASVDCFDIYQEEKYGEYYFESAYMLPSDIAKFIRETKYLPPMVVEPDYVNENFDYSYLTEKSSMILGKDNYTDKPICLDHINRQNQIPLTLNLELLLSFEDKPKEKWEDDALKQWNKFMLESYAICKDIAQLGNKFYITNKFDKRGRSYTQGYHINPQGNAFRKAMVELANKEVATK